MRIHGYVGMLALMGVCLGSVGCDEALSSVTGPTPNLEPTLSSIQRDIFGAPDSSGRAACTQCHNAVGSAFNGVNLTAGASYASLVGVASRFKPGSMRVIAGDPENSYLVHKLDGRAGIVGLRMPRNGPPYLTDGQMLVIKRWIELGARND
ncbi:MAG TPA: hypothetical protein VI485_18650 [Vicinamibacterales bacterium]|nr:hypothetical protein [Vicinamibacterales bacterium]